jgi:hypothetical protein
MVSSARARVLGKESADLLTSPPRVRGSWFQGHATDRVRRATYVVHANSPVFDKALLPKVYAS